jgi:hypothetical protein
MVMRGYGLRGKTRPLGWLIAGAALLGAFSAAVDGQSGPPAISTELRLSQDIDGATRRVPLEINPRLDGSVLFRIGPLDRNEPVIVTFERSETSHALARLSSE